jgi:hypothetical protein
MLADGWTSTYITENDEIQLSQQLSFIRVFGWGSPQEALDLVPTRTHGLLMNVSER